eukprot:jgi/Chrpa1/6336/Chrysochromulina_OHIO_Genome00013331-RA
MAGRLSAAEQERLEVDSYYNRSSSRTKPNSTLFISYRDVKPHVPKEERAVHAEGLFSAIQGYIGVRQVKGMCFVDFDGIKASTAGMMQYQGHNGLTIDYDKDAGVAGKRQRETDEKTARAQHAASSCSYFCVSCGTKALRTNGSLLGEFPVRGTDGAHVIDESKLDTLLLDGIPSAQPARVQRPKGVEKQWRLAPTYRPTGVWWVGGHLRDPPTDSEMVEMTGRIVSHRHVSYHVGYHELSIMDHWSAEARLLQADESGDVPWTYRQTSLLIEPAWQVLP